MLVEHRTLDSSWRILAHREECPQIRNPESTKNKSTPVPVNLPISRSRLISGELDPTPKIVCRNSTSKIAIPRSPSRAGMRRDQSGVSIVGSEEGASSAGAQCVATPLPD